MQPNSRSEFESSFSHFHRNHITHVETFSLEASVLHGKNEVEKVDTIIGDGTSGAEDGFIDVARVTHPTGIVSERGTIFFVDTGSKTVRLMYTSADANDSTEEQALTSIQELFKAVSSEKEADTSMHPPGNSYRSDIEPVPLLGDNHKTYQSSYTEIYSIKCKSNFFSIFISRTIDANDFFVTKYITIDKSSFLFKLSSEEAKCKKSDVICEIGKDSIRLFNGRLELSEERLCQILSDCRGECDLETNETEENQECYLDSEEEEALTIILGKKGSGRSPQRMEDFF